MLKFVVFLIGTSLLSTNAVFQEFVVSDELTRLTATSIRFGRSQPDLIDFASQLAKVKEICLSGFYIRFSQPNFTSIDGHMSPLVVPSSEYDNFCFPTNAVLQNTKSIRFIGSLNTETTSVAVYSEKYAGGQEVYTEGAGLINIPFEPKTFVTSGKSTWTFFENADLSGNATCFRSTYNVHMSQNFTNSLGLSQIGAVLRGCDSRATQFVNGTQSAIKSDISIPSDNAL
jgi:hypothetical protein